jgi:hypothetical protein
VFRLHFSPPSSWSFICTDLNPSIYSWRWWADIILELRLKTFFHPVYLTPLRNQSQLSMIFSKKEEHQKTRFKEELKKTFWEPISKVCLESSLSDLSGRSTFFSAPFELCGRTIGHQVLATLVFGKCSACLWARPLDRGECERVADVPDCPAGCQPLQHSGGHQVWEP